MFGVRKLPRTFTRTAYPVIFSDPFANQLSERRYIEYGVRRHARLHTEQKGDELS